MLGALKGNQGLVEAISLPVCLTLSPIASMTRKSKDEFMVAQVLRELIAIGTAVSFAHSGRIDKGETQSVVVGLVGGVLAIGEHGHAVCSAFVGEIEPLVRRDFKFFLVVVATLNCADVPVVS